MGATERRIPRVLKILLWLIAAVLGIPVAIVLACNLWVVFSAASDVFDEVSELEAKDVALVLGTSKKVAPTRPNRHFQNRLKAAVKLYKEGKVKHLLVSGDNATVWYNEPQDMKEALLDLGVPKDAITRDFAGFRTFDSIVRAQKVFGLKTFTIVSDDFHVSRAVFLARSQGIDVVAYASDRVALRESFKTRSREWLARVKAVLDVYVLGTEPKFSGPPEPIEIEFGNRDS